MSFKSTIGLDQHANAAIGLAKWGSAVYLIAAGLITAIATISSAITNGSMPEAELAQVGGVFFWMFLSLLGMWLIMGFVGSVLITAVARRIESRGEHA